MGKYGRLENMPDTCAERTSVSRHTVVLVCQNPTLLVTISENQIEMFSFTPDWMVPPTLLPEKVAPNTPCTRGSKWLEKEVE
jgi:hypothetical protein